MREAGSDAAGISQPLIVVEQAEQEPLETTFANHRAPVESANHELRSLLAFDFEPIQTPAAGIGRLATFTDNALEPCASGFGKNLLAMPNHPASLTRNGPRSVGSFNCVAQRLRLLEWAAAQINPVEIEEIENDARRRQLGLGIAKGVFCSN